MRMQFISFLSFFLIFFLSLYHSPSFARRSKKKNKSIHTEIKQKQKDTTLFPKQYTVKSFNNLKDVAGISIPQLDQHQKLYAGYINKRNEIDDKLKLVDRTNIDNITYSPFRSLKISQTFARNGALLHELYFENLSAEKKIKPHTEALLKKNFGSIAAFKKDLMDCASCSRGWVVTSYCIDDGHVKNFVLDAHNETVPILTVPILVIDIYEHAYMIDFGINRAAYLKTMWENINWDVIENRVNKWVNPHISMIEKK